MKIDEDQTPRRDGYVEARGTWGEITIGTTVAMTSDRTNAWEVIGARTPEQWEYAHTPWFRVREVNTGEERSVKPRLINQRVRILLRPGQTTLPARKPVDDAERAMEMVTMVLGAQEIYTQDARTGEVWCPHLDGELILHMQVAHAIDTSAIESITDIGDRIAQMHRIHGRAHASKYDVGKGGFPHRHVPEEHDIL